MTTTKSYGIECHEFNGENFEVRQAKPKRLVFKNKNWKVYCDKDYLITFQAYYEENPQKKNELNTELAELERQLAKENDVEIANDLRAKIKGIEKDIAFYSGWFSWGKFKCRLANRAMLDDFLDCLSEWNDPDNIWSLLGNTWLSFGNKKKSNNLECILSDEELDSMTVSEATSYSEEWKNKFPWVWTPKNERC